MKEYFPGVFSSSPVEVDVVVMVIDIHFALCCDDLLRDWER